MKGLYYIGFILVLFPVLVLGHDLYLAWYVDGEIDIAQPIKFSDLGWLWVQYGPETYNWTRNAVQPETWEGFISPILRLNSLVATAVPAASFLLVTLFLKIFGIWPFSEGIIFTKRVKVKGSKSAYTFGETNTKGPYKYNRK